MKLINILIGDRFDDGHGKHSSRIFLCNKDREEIMKAYKKGSKKVGFNLIDTVATEYEEWYIDKKIVEKLKKHGFDGEFEDSYGKEETHCRLYESLYLEIFQFIVQLGDPSIEFEPAGAEAIDIGGYGLF